MKEEHRLRLYQWAVNRIDDYLEYRYMSAKSVGEVKEHIMGIIDELTKQLEKTK